MRGASAKTAYELSLGENAAPEGGYESLDNGTTEVWFKFTPDIAGKYLINTDGTSGTEVWRVWEHTGSLTDIQVYKQQSTYYNLVADKTYYIQCDSDYNNDFAITVECPAGTSKDNPLTLSTENTEGTTVNYKAPLFANNTWLKFTPSESGYYEFRTNGYTSGSSIYVYEGRPASTADFIDNIQNYHKLAVNLTAGTTYYVNVSSSFSSSNSFETVCQVYVSATSAGADATSAIMLELGNNAAQNWEALENGSEIWFKFTPETTGFYSFSLSDGSSYNPYAAYTGVNQSGSASSTTLYGKYGFTLSANTTYYLYYSLSSGYGSFGVNVEKVNTGKNSTDAIEMTLDNALQAGYYSNFNSSGEVWFKFVPTVSGKYRFTVGDASRRYVYIKDSSLYNINYNSSYVSSSSNYLDADLTAGQTYYLMVDFYSSSYYDSSFYVSVGETRYGSSATDAIKLSSNSQTVGYNSSYCSGGVMWFEFTATSATNYVYLSDLNSSYYTLTELYAYNSLNSDYTLIGSYGRRTSSMNVSATADLVVGETYYVKVSFAYNSGYSPSSSYADTNFYAYIY